MIDEVTGCPRCHRKIDRGARMCPYCNFDLVLGQVPPQAAPEPSEQASGAAPPAAAAARKANTRLWSTRVLVIAAVAALLITTFAVGALVRGFHSGSETKLRNANEAPKAAAAPGPTAGDLNLVPMDDPTQTIGRSVTSMPVPDPDHATPGDYQRSDATALPADQYSKILQQAATQTAAPPPAVLDPRTITSQAPATVPDELRQREAAQRAREAARRADAAQDAAATSAAGDFKEASPISQPLPQVHGLKQDVTLRFRLLIGADGRVKEVDIVQGQAGLTAKMIGAIQKWKFKPATRNGQPVESSFPVDIFFNAE